MDKKKFRSKFVNARYVVNTSIILILFTLPTFHIIKFDFLNARFYLFGSATTWLETSGGFLGFWAGSYVITLLADFIWGRLFCGWICTWGTLLKTLGYIRDDVKRKRLPHLAAPAALVAATLLSTCGLLNWFTDLSVLFKPSHSAFIPFVSTFLALNLAGGVMLWRVGHTFCQNYCPIGWYLTSLSQKHTMRIDFEAANCTLGDVCVKECPMALDPRLLAMDTDKDSHALCILCGDCLISCNKCAAKVEGTKPLQLVVSSQPIIDIDLSQVLANMRKDKRAQRAAPKQMSN